MNAFRFFALPLFFFLAALLTAAPTQAQSPISLQGYNADVITDKNAATRYAESLDIGTAAYFEAGAVDDNGDTHDDGLPIGSFTSDFTNTVTGQPTVFAIQPADSVNALLLRYDPHNPAANVGTLTLIRPERYHSLAILAAGYNASPTDMGSLVLTFTDGSKSPPLAYDAGDWGFGTGHRALAGMGRNYDVGANGKQFHYNQPEPFSVFETDLDLSALGLSEKTIAGVTFTGGTVSDQVGVPNHGPSTTILGISGVPAPDTHQLWTHTSGLASVWNINADGSYTYQIYGPYDGWTAIALADGPDGQTRLLWTHAGGLASLWNLADPHPDQTCLVYGPFDGWSATGLSVGADAVPHILWTHAGGPASVWSVNADGSYTYQIYGPYDGWNAQSLAAGSDGKVRLLWTHAGGLASLWNLGDAHPDQSCLLYGPFDGWSATGLSIGSDNIPHLLWTHTSGLASSWNVNTDGTYTYQLYGPYAGWAATGISIDSSNTVHFLWTHTGGLDSLWNLADPQPDQSCLLYGPFDGWSAVSLTTGS